MQQLTLFDDLFPEEKVVKTAYESGKWYDDNADIAGDVIPFRKLREYIGKDVVYKCESGYKVVCITGFTEDSDPVYRKLDDFRSESGLVYDEYVNAYIHDVCMPKDLKPHYGISYYSDRVMFSDNLKKRTKGDCSVAEHYCSNGRRTLCDEIMYCCFFEVCQ